ncbi:MAG: MmgE/PrpD family protein [Dehalococcoidia bacterium]|nr:MmgE/PrpD family protein [Dehalococcoidia bacterium]
MDKTTERISEYSSFLTFEDLPGKTVHQAKRRIIDALGCATGGYSSEPAAIARKLASGISSSQPARILGSGQPTSVEMAAFANSVALRYLDCNDTYVTKGGGHPSDMLGGVLAVAEMCHASGKQTIAAAVLAYEVCGRFSDEVPLPELGWDQGALVVIGTACAACNLMGMSHSQTAHAISLAIVPNMPLVQTRMGELSMWKGCATAASVRAGVFAAQLAREGMEGPADPIEGQHGLWEQVGGGPRELGSFGGRETPFMIDDTSLKYFPSQIHTQAPISIALELRKQVGVEDIVEINVDTYKAAWRSAGSEPEKWDPQTRETADHSIPYLVAVALRDGAVTPSTYLPERIGDPSLRPLMQKIRVTENADFTARYPGSQECRIEAVSTDGRRLVKGAGFPKGHALNPIDDSELEAKFAGLAGERLTNGQTRRALEVLWKLEDVEDAGEIVDLFIVNGSA